MTQETVTLHKRQVTQVGVLLIHGIGQSNTDYSTKFRQRLKKTLQKEYKIEEPHDVCFEEVFWGSVTKSAQSEVILNNEVFTDVVGHWPLGVIRRLVLRNLADAAAYQDLDETKRQNRYAFYSGEAGKDAPETSFKRIQDSIRRSMTNLASKVQKDSPLIVVAHSFGGHVISTYISDLETGALTDPPTNDFESFKTLAGIVTIGCNIPAFVFSLHPAEVIPITVPAQRCNALTHLCNEQGVRTWLNYYNIYDVLGYPLRTINEKYNNAVSDCRLSKLPTFNIAWAHAQYWRNRAVINDTARLVFLAQSLGAGGTNTPPDLSDAKLHSVLERLKRLRGHAPARKQNTAPAASGDGVAA